MPITIIVEDGSNVPNANSYNSVASAREYAGNRGVELDPDDEVVATQLIQAMDYIEAKECEFQGERTYDDQALSFPRTGMFINCKELAANIIPAQVKGAQIQIVMAIESGVDIFPNVEAGDYVTSERVGPLSVSYANPTKVGSGSLTPTMTAVEALLKPLIGVCSSVGFSVGRA